jgi:hypothetical protein
MPEDEDWLLKPVVEGMCSYENLKNCVLDLEDIARMNDALAVKTENERLYREANEQ